MRTDVIGFQKIKKNLFKEMFYFSRLMQINSIFTMMSFFANCIYFLKLWAILSIYESNKIWLSQIHIQYFKHKY
jgi:hypothetical protein